MFHFHKNNMVQEFSFIIILKNVKRIKAKKEQKLKKISNF